MAERPRPSSSTNVQVVVRVRPLSERELASCVEPPQPIVRVVDDKMLVFDPRPDVNPGEPSLLSTSSRKRPYRDITKRAHRDLKFGFDHVFNESADNQAVFEATTKRVVSTFLQGFNCSVFAYGATGAGKTHTMLGRPDNPGVILRTMNELFSEIELLKDERTCEISISYLEIYNEKIKDLLTPAGTTNPTATVAATPASGKRQKRRSFGTGLPLREDHGGSISVSGLSVHRPNDADELFEMLQRGNHNRTQHPTDANRESSRSHAVFQVFLKSWPRSADLDTQYQLSKMSLIDLAGSERATATTNRGARMREGSNINRSLLALGNVINALAMNKKGKFVPYRDSKLTRLLKDSLGGNCSTIMIAALSPSSHSFEDTYNTLRYADRAKQIRAELSKNVVSVQLHIANYARIVDDQRAEIAELKAKLAFLEDALGANWQQLSAGGSRQPADVRRFIAEKFQAAAPQTVVSRTTAAPQQTASQTTVPKSDEQPPSPSPTAVLNNENPFSSSDRNSATFTLTGPVRSSLVAPNGGETIFDSVATGSSFMSTMMACGGGSDVEMNAAGSQPKVIESGDNFSLSQQTDQIHQLKIELRNNARVVAAVAEQCQSTELMIRIKETALDKLQRLEGCVSAAARQRFQQSIDELKRKYRDEQRRLEAAEANFSRTDTAVDQLKRQLIQSRDSPTADASHRADVEPLLALLAENEREAQLLTLRRDLKIAKRHFGLSCKQRDRFNESLGLFVDSSVHQYRVLKAYGLLDRQIGTMLKSAVQSVFEFDRRVGFTDDDIVVAISADQPQQRPLAGVPSTTMPPPLLRLGKSISSPKVTNRATPATGPSPSSPSSRVLRSGTSPGSAYFTAASRFQPNAAAKKPTSKRAKLAKDVEATPIQTFSTNRFSGSTVRRTGVGQLSTLKPPSRSLQRSAHSTAVLLRPSCPGVGAEDNAKGTFAVSKLARINERHSNSFGESSMANAGDENFPALATGEGEDEGEGEGRGGGGGGGLSKSAHEVSFTIGQHKPSSATSSSRLVAAPVCSLRQPQAPPGYRALTKSAALRQAAKTRLKKANTRTALI